MALQDRRAICRIGQDNAQIFGAPRALAMRKPRSDRQLPVRSGFAHRKGAGRAEYLRVVLSYAADGTPVLQRHGRKGAGVLSSLTGADGLVEIPVENEGVAVGDYLSFMPFRETGL